MESHVSGSGSRFLADRTPAAAGASHTHVTPADAGWERVSFRLDLLDAGGSVDRVADGEEIALVPISGRLKVDALGTSWTLGDRGSVFDGPPEALYLPLGTEYRVQAEVATEWATCGAACERVLQPKLVTSEDYSVEIRGAGNATRQVVTIVPPEFPSDRLLVVEVWTPAGNWSSYPPHKHDVLDMPTENRLEEIYHYRLQGEGGFALQRIYDPTRGVDETFVVRDGDTAIIPWGYHTTAAAPGYPLYYLNVLAGDEHSLNAHNDESHSWVRNEWPQQDADPRVPLFGPSA